MTEECFVIMPIADMDGYPAGHFKHVYEQLICPAVRNAGYSPIRADDVKAPNLIHVDVISRIINSPMCVCDLSGKNANVMFELGIRQAFDLPAILIKDEKTNRVFDINGFRDIEYTETMHISNIKDKIKEIELAIKSVNENKKDDVFSLVRLLAIGKAASIPETNVSGNKAMFQMLQTQINSVQEGLNDLTDAIKSRNNKISKITDPRINEYSSVISDELISKLSKMYALKTTNAK